MENGHTPNAGGKTISCSDIEVLLDDYIDGQLDPFTRTRFEQHLSHCEDCNNLVLDCSHIVAVAKTLAEQPIPPDVSHRLRKRLEEEIGCKFSGPHLHVVDANSK